MIAFSIRGTNVRVHISLIVMLALASLLGSPEAIAVTVASITAHEAGHALAAKLSGVRINEIELMPFGAAARIEDMYGLSASKAVAVALAGPAVSFALFAVSGLFSGGLGGLARGVNASIAAFNLLPALPLDGGRAASRLLAGRLGARRATGICVAFGRFAAVAMLACAAMACAATGVINATCVMSAIYILMSGKREKLAAGGAMLLTMLDRKKYMSSSGAMPVKWLAATESTGLDKLLAGFSPGSVHRIAVYDGDMRLRGVLEEDALLKACVTSRLVTVGELI